MDRVSLALIYRYFLFRLKQRFIILEISGLFIIFYFVLTLFLVKRNEYAYFQQDIIVHHHLSTLYYVMTVVSMCFTLIYVLSIKDSLEDALIRTRLSKNQSIIFHGLFLIFGLLMWMIWGMGVYTLIEIYFNQLMTLPFQWMMHLLIDGLIIYLLWVFIPFKPPTLFYMGAKLFVLTVGIEESKHHVFIKLLNHVGYDKKLSYPFEWYDGLIVVCGLFVIGLFVLHKNRHL